MCAAAAYTLLRCWLRKVLRPCRPSRHSCVQFLRSTFAADLHTALLACLLAILDHKANEKPRISHYSYLSQTCLSWNVFFCDFSSSELPAATSQKSDVFDFQASFEHQLYRFPVICFIRNVWNCYHASLVISMPLLPLPFLSPSHSFEGYSTRVASPLCMHWWGNNGLTGNGTYSLHSTHLR